MGLQFALLGMRLGIEMKDNHEERTWYDYDAEVVEPVAPVEASIGLKVKQRFVKLDASFFDVSFDENREGSPRQKVRRQATSKLSRSSRSRNSTRKKSAKQVLLQNTLSPDGGIDSPRSTLRVSMKQLMSQSVKHEADTLEPESSSKVNPLSLFTRIKTSMRGKVKTARDNLTASQMAKENAERSSQNAYEPEPVEISYGRVEKS